MTRPAAGCFCPCGYAQSKVPVMRPLAFLRFCIAVKQSETPPGLLPAGVLCFFTEKNRKNFSKKYARCVVTSGKS